MPAGSLRPSRSWAGAAWRWKPTLATFALKKTIANAVREAFGGLDIVVVNAGIGDFRPIAQWDEAGFDRSFAVNLKGQFFLIPALLPLLANPASIVLMGSINGHIGMPNTTIYAATKAGLISLAKTLSGELLPRGVRANVVSPGPIATAFHEKIGMDEAAVKALVAQIPAGRRGVPVEVADAVVFLASDESAFCVGSEIVIEGGMSTLSEPLTPNPSPVFARACRVHRFGSPDAIAVEDVEVPALGAGEVRVRVRAAGVGPWDAWCAPARAPCRSTYP
jgi:NAD(P)-dependent dehydrogenase (short-subunit alcohol dehydrogenase family)